MYNAQLKKVKGQTKDGKDWTAYKFIAGDFETALFFPTRIEAKYLDAYLNKVSREDFQDGDSDSIFD